MWIPSWRPIAWHLLCLGHRAIDSALTVSLVHVGSHTCCIWRIRKSLSKSLLNLLFFARTGDVLNKLNRHPLITKTTRSYLNSTCSWVLNDHIRKQKQIRVRDVFFKRCKLVLYFHPQRRISPGPFPERKWWNWSEQTDLQGKVAICSCCWNCATCGLWTVDLSTALELRNLVERVKACCLISIKEACSYVNIQ